MFQANVTGDKKTFRVGKMFKLLFKLSLFSISQFYVDAIEESCPKEGCPTLPFDRDLLKFDQEDPELIARIKKNQLIPPPSSEQPLSLNINEMNWPTLVFLAAQYGQPFAIEELFYGQKFVNIC